MQMRLETPFVVPSFVDDVSTVSGPVIIPVPMCCHVVVENLLYTVMDNTSVKRNRF